MNVRWSPDSKKIATFRQDQRTVSDMYLVSTNVGKPSLRSWKYPLPGDKDIPMIHRVIIDVEPAKIINLQVAADPHRASLSDDISSSGTFDDVDWKGDASQLAFVSTSRDHNRKNSVSPMLLQVLYGKFLKKPFLRNMNPDRKVLTGDILLILMKSSGIRSAIIGGIFIYMMLQPAN